MTPSGTFRFGGLSIEASAYGSQGSAILGIRDSGKTYTATLLAEKLFGAGVPFIAFDPIGVWRFLRVPGKGAGLPVVVAGGKHSDLALSPATAPAIVEAAMQNGISLIIDLFHIDLSKADWRRIVRDCVRLLLHKNHEHGLRHVFIEEAAEFAPQRVIDGDVYAEIEKLGRMGGNARLGYTLINQRAEEVNKAVLELCDNLFLHRQKGRNSLTALSKWLDIGNVKDHKEIIGSLSTLPTGQCWAWLAGSERPILVKVPEKHSLHPDRRVMRGDDQAIQAKTVDVGDFVSSLRDTLPTIAAEAEANDPKKLRAKIAELERQAKAPAAPVIDQQAIESAARAAKLEGHREAAAMYAEPLAALKSQLQAIAINLGDLIGKTADWEKQVKPATVRAIPQTRYVAVHDQAARRAAPKHAGAGEPMPNPQRKLLTVLAQYPQGRTKKQLAVLAGYAHNGGAFNNPLSNLRSRGWAEGSADRIAITDTGLSALGSWEPLPTGAALREYWFNNLAAPHAKLLRALCEVYPLGLSKEELAERCGYAPTGGAFNNPLSRLRSLELANGRGEIRASEDLFE